VPRFTTDDGVALHYEIWPQGRLLEIRDAGEAMTLTHPAVLQAAILEFVRTL
jgi:hypothetical protein